jgi:hypothetical protein
MPSLPPLKSGQIAQYPFRRTIRQDVDTVAFLDGSEQRCVTTKPLHRWKIDLALLDEQEMRSLTDFILQQQGQTGRFDFTDPADGVTYPNCSFAMDANTIALMEEGRLKMQITIRENRS